MANIKSQKKRILTNEKARQRNMAQRSKVRTMLKQALVALEEKDAEKAKVAIPRAISTIDRAVAKGVVHRNSAARKKSMLQQRLTAL